jgi:hypothetical protein
MNQEEKYEMQEPNFETRVRALSDDLLREIDQTFPGDDTAAYVKVMVSSAVSTILNYAREPA